MFQTRDDRAKTIPNGPFDHTSSGPFDNGVPVPEPERMTIELLEAPPAK